MPVANPTSGPWRLSSRGITPPHPTKIVQSPYDVMWWLRSPHTPSYFLQKAVRGAAPNLPSGKCRPDIDVYQLASQIYRANDIGDHALSSPTRVVALPWPLLAQTESLDKIFN